MWRWLALICCMIAAPAWAVNDDAIMAEKPAALLSAYGLFEDAAADQPAKGVIAYKLVNPLFTDYALKFRFAYVPDGQSAGFHDKDAFRFPVGSVLIKTFAYPADFRSPDKAVRKIETRLLIHKPSGWIGLPYVWNAQGTDAKLKRAGARMQLSWFSAEGAAQSTRYVVPNMNQCKGCHIYNKAMVPIGPTARNLNRDVTGPAGTAINQLSWWQTIGLLDAAADISSADTIADIADERAPLNLRARAYLDINCAHCHRAGGPADTSGLFLNYDEHRPAHWGYKKRPVAAGRGSGGFQFDIDPGHPERSIISYRMNSVDPGIAMPELGRTMVHKQGLALINKWIEDMDE